MTRNIRYNGTIEEVMDLDELLNKYNNDYDKITDNEWMFLSQDDKDRYESEQLDF